MKTIVNCCLPKVEQCVVYFNINKKPHQQAKRQGPGNILLNYKILMNQVNKLNIKITNPHLTGCINKPVY